jgi:hypothetical protein
MNRDGFAARAVQPSVYFFPLAALSFLGFLTFFFGALLPFAIGVSFAFQKGPVNFATL